MWGHSPIPTPNGVTPEPEPLSKLDQLAGNISGQLQAAKALLAAIRAPLPTQTGDGTALPVPPQTTVSGDIDAVMQDLRVLGFDKIEALLEVVTKAQEHSPIDDKTYLMERLIQAAAVLPTDGMLSEKITSTFITQLWNDLEHPPQTLLSEDYQYRQPDGSKNSYQNPQIGAAGMPYARTVTPKTMQDGVLPDPAVLFDTLMARKKQEGTDHPNKISSMLFYLASIIIHDCFKTNRRDYRVSDTSSYLDLAPLYGSNWAEQKRMRTMKDGKIKPDCFSETRLLGFPPGVGAILIMFNRYHNYIVEQLALINEDGRFTEDSRRPLVERYGEQINKRDDDLFQTGRLITCGLYVNIILVDYVRTILNLNRTDSNWSLDPRIDVPGGPPRGVGNQVSAEFNLVYRWHATVSARDDEWTQQLFKETIEAKTGVSAAEAADSSENMAKFLRQLGEDEAVMTAMDPMERPFPALQSQREQMPRIQEGPYKGRFRDEDLAKILTESIEDCANSFGSQQVPIVMKAVEILGIQQARTWKLATLNEFRKHFGLEPHAKFSDITDNVEVQEVLMRLYEHPDNVELYPGLVVEDAKRPLLPGSGLCPSYTVSRGVLSDAVALVRGDRFFTTSYTPTTLTNWGYTEASSDPEIDNGCVWYKLFLRALPQSYDPCSVYVHYPLTVPHGPDGMQDILERLGKADMYNFDRPATVKQPTVIFSYAAARQVLEDSDTFSVTWGKAMEYLMGKDAHDFMLAGDRPANTTSRKLMEQALFNGDSSRAIPKGTEKWFIAVRDFFEETTTRLLKEKSFNLGKMKQVDLIRDVGNLVSVHFAAELFGLPMKTEIFPHGIYNEQQLYMIFAATFTCVFFDLDPPKSFPLRLAARKYTQQLGQVIEGVAIVVKATGRLPVNGEALISSFMPPSAPLREYGAHLIARLLSQQPGVSQLVFGNILGTCTGMVCNQGQVFSQAMEYLLKTENGRHLEILNGLAKENTPEADEKILHYMLEASRLGAETGVVRYVSKDVTIIDETVPLGKRTLNLKKGDRVMVNLISASKDPIAFPNPEQIDLTRPLGSYIQLGYGLHQCIGLPMTYASLPTMLKVVARLDGLRPAKVSIGRQTVPDKLQRVVREFYPGSLNDLPESWHYHAFLTHAWEGYFPFPQSLKVNWDHDTLNEPTINGNGLANDSADEEDLV